MPAIDATVIPKFGTALLNPSPAATEHDKLVKDVQLDERHSVPPINAVLVESYRAKFRPDMEIRAPPEAG